MNSAYTVISVSEKLLQAAVDKLPSGLDGGRGTAQACATAIGELVAAAYRDAPLLPCRYVLIEVRNSPYDKADVRDHGAVPMATAATQGRFNLLRDARDFVGKSRCSMGHDPWHLRDNRNKCIYCKHQFELYECLGQLVQEAANAGDFPPRLRAIAERIRDQAVTRIGPNDVYIVDRSLIQELALALGGSADSSLPASDAAAELIESVMLEVQAFASHWALVGTKYDDGTRLEQSSKIRARIRARLHNILGSAS